MEEKVQYELMLPFEFERRIRRFPLIYVPVGSLEWHGEHMALGNDAIKIHVFSGGRNGFSRIASPSMAAE